MGSDNSSTTSSQTVETLRVLYPRRTQVKARLPYGPDFIENFAVGAVVNWEIDATGTPWLKIQTDPDDPDAKFWTEESGVTVVSEAAEGEVSNDTRFPVGSAI